MDRMDEFRRCKKCEKVKPIEQFAWTGRNHKWRIRVCRTCKGVYKRRHYRNNIESYKVRGKLNAEKSRRNAIEFTWGYKSTHPCVDCGESDPVVLVFDHVRGIKLLTVSRMAHRGWSIKNIAIEIQKCEVRCANCHRKRHRDRYKYITP